MTWRTTATCTQIISKRQQSIGLTTRRRARITVTLKKYTRRERKQAAVAMPQKIVFATARLGQQPPLRTAANHRARRSNQEQAGGGSEQRRAQRLPKILETTTAMKRRKISCTFCSDCTVSNLSLDGRCSLRSLQDSANVVISRLLARNCNLL